MDEYDGELTEVEERLLKLIEAQSELLKEFISETERRLEELEESREKHEDSINGLESVTSDLVGKVDDLETNKQDVPAPYELKYQKELEESEKAEREEFEKLMTEQHEELVSRVESLEGVVTPSGESLDAAIERVSESLAELEEFVRSRLK
jgi:chromosome segregation ATPase